LEATQQKPPILKKPVGLVKQTAREGAAPKQNEELKGTGWEEVAK